MKISFSLFAALSLICAACGGGSSQANVEIGVMPEGGTYTGVFFSPQYGEMHLVQTGASVVGEYHKDERDGRIQGTLQGNVLRFEWSEERELVIGRPNVNRGRGYFQYMIDSNGDHVIVGEWGSDDSETGGGPWRGVKSRNRRPQLSTQPGGPTSGGEMEPAEPTGNDGLGSPDESLKPQD